MVKSGKQRLRNLFKKSPEQLRATEERKRSSASGFHDKRGYSRKAKHRKPYSESDM
jgi:hypothetical protein